MEVKRTKSLLILKIKNSKSCHYGLRLNNQNQKLKRLILLKTNKM